jgi:hypothetical protein
MNLANVSRWRFLLLILIGLITGCGVSQPKPADAGATGAGGSGGSGGATGAGGATVATGAGGAGGAVAFNPTMTMIMGANGAPGDAQGLGFWKDMGLRFGRIEIGPINSTDAQDFKAKGYFSKKADDQIQFNNASGVSTLILLAYSSNWNAIHTDDDKSGPKDVSVWTAYVEAVVSYYSAPPFNVKYFQIWNEAAGKLTGGQAQSTFWHGPGDLSQSYATAMEDYVNLVHIPAAQVIRSHGAYVVYGGWPDQGGIDTYTTWLEYKSPSFNSATMLEWTDYLDIHYLNSNDMEYLYKRYVGTSKIRGVWQTEVGFDYMSDHNYIARTYFSVAAMALRNGWADPDQFVVMVYHWLGGQGFMLVGLDKMIHDSGTSLKTLSSVMNGTLSQFSNDLSLSPNAKATAIYNGKQIVVQIIAPKGAATIDVDNLTAPAGYQIAYEEAVFGTDLASSIKSSSWSGSHLSVALDVPDGRNDLKGTKRDLMGYIVITPN